MSATSSVDPRFTSRAVIVSVLLGSLCLTGCTDSDFSLTADDAVGTWRAGSALPAELQLADDNTFIATAWPLDIWCADEPTLTVDALQRSENGDFSGTWEEGDGMSQNQLTLYPEGNGCPAEVFMDFRSENGVKYTCIDLGVANEESSAVNFFILYLGEPKDAPDSEACFSYG